MTINIVSPDGSRLAESRRFEVVGLPGVGIYTMVLRIGFTVNSPKTELFLENPSVRVEWGDHRQQLLGVALADESPLVRILPHHNEAQLNFRVPLSARQIEFIESLRNGGDFRLGCWLSTLTKQGDAVGSSYGRTEFNVPQQDWVRALSSMEYEQLFLFELPVPRVGDKVQPVGDIVSKAQGFLFGGHYDQCVAECRKLLEAYPLNDDESTLLRQAREKYKGEKANRESMNIGERLLVLRDSISHATQLAHHHHLGDGYSRDQARGILAATIAVLAARFSGRNMTGNAQ